MTELSFLLMTHAWQIAVLVVAVGLIVRTAARQRPHLAHALWLLVLIKCLTPPVWGHSLGIFSRMQMWRTDADAWACADPAVGGDKDAGPTLSPALQSAHRDPGRPDPETGGRNGPPRDSNQAGRGRPPADTELSFAWARSADSGRPGRSRSLSGRIVQLIPVIFICGAVLSLITIVFRGLRCCHAIVQRRTSGFDALLTARVQSIGRRLGLRRLPRVIVSDTRFGPAVLGLVRHVIVLPRCLFEQIDEKTSPQRQSGILSTVNAGLPNAIPQRPAVSPEGELPIPASDSGTDLALLDLILAHELLHIRRGDLLSGILQTLARCLWWCHPAVWFASRQLSREAERCCDEQVIAELGCPPARYARSLLSVIERKHSLQPLPVFPGMRPVEITAQRLERIMSPGNGMTKRTPISSWMMLLVLAVLVLPGAAIGLPRPEVPADSKTTTNAQSESNPAQDRSPDSTICVYSVADLIVPLRTDLHAALGGNSGPPVQPAALQQRLSAAVRHGTVQGQAAEAPPGNVASGLGRPGEAQLQDKPAGPVTADFAPLIELIRASVAPDSWNPGGNATIAADPATLSLIVRQTTDCQDEISALLSTLRDEQHRMVVIETSLWALNQAGLQTLEDNANYRLHAQSSGSRWALLPGKQTRHLTQTLQNLNAERLTAPRILTVDGQSAMVQVGQSEEDTFQLWMNPHMIGNGRFFRLKYAATAGQPGTGSLDKVTQEALIGSGQTLLVLLTPPGSFAAAGGTNAHAPIRPTSDSEAASPATPALLLQMTLRLVTPEVREVRMENPSALSDPASERPARNEPAPQDPATNQVRR